MLIPAGHVQVNFRFGDTAAPTGAECTLGLDLDLAEPDPEAVGTTCALAWVTNILPRQVSSIRLEDVLVKFGPNATGPMATVGAGNTGGTSGESEAPQVALLVQKVTGAGGRTGRGRMFIPGVPTAEVNSAGQIIPTSVAAWTTALEDFRQDLLTAGLIPSLLHSPGSPITAPLPITSFVVSGRSATQRKRNRR